MRACIALCVGQKRPQGCLTLCTRLATVAALCFSSPAGYERLSLGWALSLAGAWAGDCLWQVDHVYLESDDRVNVLIL